MLINSLIMQPGLFADRIFLVFDQNRDGVLDFGLLLFNSLVLYYIIF